MPPCWTDVVLDLPVYVLSVLVSPMHVNLFLFSTLHVVDSYFSSFELYCILTLCISRLCTSPVSHVTSHHPSAPVFIQCALYCIITDEGNHRLPKRLTL